MSRLETIRWEREFYRAHATFQAQIPEAADCDVVIAILKHRLGTELPEEFSRRCRTASGIRAGQPTRFSTAMEGG